MPGINIPGQLSNFHPPMEGNKRCFDYCVGTQETFTFVSPGKVSKLPCFVVVIRTVFRKLIKSDFLINLIKKSIIQFTAVPKSTANLTITVEIGENGLWRGEKLRRSRFMAFVGVNTSSERLPWKNRTFKSLTQHFQKKTAPKNFPPSEKRLRSTPFPINSNLELAVFSHPLRILISIN